jgi:hypothetical protein
MKVGGLTEARNRDWFSREARELSLRVLIMAVLGVN